LKYKGVDAGVCRKPMKSLDQEGITRAEQITEKHL